MACMLCVHQFYVLNLISWVSGFTYTCAKICFLLLAASFIYYFPTAFILTLQLRFTVYLCVCLLLILCCMQVLYLEFVLWIFIALLKYFWIKKTYKLLTVLHVCILTIVSEKIHTGLQIIFIFSLSGDSIKYKAIKYQNRKIPIIS